VNLETRLGRDVVFDWMGFPVCPRRVQGNPLSAKVITTTRIAAIVENIIVIIIIVVHSSRSWAGRGWCDVDRG
jgi:hypothetical protein